MPSFPVQEPCDAPLPCVMIDRPGRNLAAQLLPSSTPSEPGDIEILDEEAKVVCFTKMWQKVGPDITSLGNHATLGLEKMKARFDSMHNSAHPLDVVKPHFDSMQGSMRPWQEFCILAKPDGDGWQRLQVNLRHYRSNYAVGFFGLSSAYVLVSPPSLLAIGILTIVWMKFLKKSEDHEWEVHLGSYELTKTKQWIALDMVTGLVLLFVVGKHIVLAALISSMAATGHGVMHPLPFIMDSSDAMESGSLHPLPDHMLETSTALEDGSLHASTSCLDNMD